MSDSELADMIDTAKRQAGINDVAKLYKDYMDRIQRNDIILRTRYRKGILVTSNSSY